MKIEYWYVKYIVRQIKLAERRNKIPEVLYYEALVLNEYTKGKLYYEEFHNKLENWIRTVNVSKLDKKGKLTHLRPRLNGRRVSTTDLAWNTFSYLPSFICAGLVYSLSESQSFMQFIIKSNDIVGYLVIALYLIVFGYGGIGIVRCMLDTLYSITPRLHGFMSKYRLATLKVQHYWKGDLSKIKKDLCVSEYDLTYEEMVDLDLKVLRNEYYKE